MVTKLELESLATHYIEQCGFKVIYAVKDDFYMLRPVDKEEAEKYGTAVFSPRAMQAMGELLSKF